MRIAIVVGEASGDRLGAGLMEALKAQCPTASFLGVGGEGMKAQGLTSLFDAQELAVMGFLEPLKVLPRLWRRFRQIVAAFVADPPDVLITIDAPDFNVRLAKALKKQGLRCPMIHYVSPSVWAWRQGRIHTLKACFDEVLTLFPFEQAFYKQHEMPATCVGHPMAQNTPCLSPTEHMAAQRAARQALALRLGSGPLVALLPGSRTQELERMWPRFWKAFLLIKEQHPHAVALTATPHAQAATWLATWQDQHPEASWLGLPGGVDQVLQAADVALTTSGTVTLEAMVHQCPMVIAYAMNPWMFALARRWIALKHVGLPNLLAGTLLVPECLQKDATPPRLAEEALRWLDPSNGAAAAFRTQSHRLHQSLQKGGSALAAQRVLAHVQRTSQA